MRRRSALRGRDRRQGVLSVLASSTGRVGTDLTRAWIRSDGPWTGETEPRERSFPSPKLPPSLEPEFGHPLSRRNRGLSFLTSGTFSNKPGHKYHSSQPKLEESTQQLRPEEPGSTTEGLTDPPIRVEPVLGIPPIRTHLSFMSYKSRNPWAPGSSERGLLTQPVQDLLGVRLLAKRLEFFGKSRQATKVGSDVSTRISRDPRLLELLEVLELLHRLQRKGEVSILREICSECCSLLPDCLLQE